MSAQRGRDFLVKAKTESGDYVTLAGLRSKRLKLGAQTVDVTHSESIGAWRELLPGAGIRSAEISGTGIFTSATSDVMARQALFDQSELELQIILPGFGQISGPFLISELSYAGTYNGEAQFELTFVSSGAPQFTGAA